MSRPVVLTLVLVLALAGMLAIFLLQRPQEIPLTPAREKSPGTIPPPVAAAPEFSAPAAVFSPPPAPRAVFDRLLEALRAGDRERAKQLLEELRRSFIPAPVPDKENAALLYKEAFAKYPEGMTDEEAGLVERLSAGRAITAEERATLEKVLERGRESLELLHLAGGFPRCDFGLDYSKGLAMELPHISGMIRAAKLLALEALLGEGPDVERSAEAVLRLAEGTAGEPILVSQLVRGVCHGIASEVQERAFQGDLPQETLNRLIRGLAPEAMRGAYEKAMLFELYAGVKFVLEGGSAKVFGIPEDTPLRRPDDPLTPEDLAHYASTLSEYASLAGGPYYEVRDRVARLYQERVEGAPWFAEVSRMLMPSLDRALAARAAAEATAGAGQLAAALRIYRIGHGAYPDSLESLGGTVPGMPLDPFTGKPYRYRREGSGFVVWSVGKDGTDGGGVSKDSDVIFRSPR